MLNNFKGDAMYPLDAQNSKVNVLVIEDNHDFALVLRDKILSARPNWMVIMTTTSELAVKQLETNPNIEIILIDLNLPGQNGLEICRLFVSKFYQKRLFLMTGYDDIYTEIETRVYGVEKLFTKPFEIDQFVDLVENPRVKNRKDHIIPIELERILPHKVLPFDLYISFSFKDKVIKYFNAGEIIDETRINKLIKQGHLFLFSDREQYIQNYMDIYIGIRVSTLIPGVPLTFGIVQETEGDDSLDSFSPFKKPGDKVIKPEIEMFKKKKVRKLYILNEDEPKYQKYIDDGLDKLLKSKDSSVEDRATAVHQYSINKIQKAFTDPSNDSIYELNSVKDYLSGFLDGDGDGIKKLLDIDQGDDRTYQHALNVAALSYALYLRIQKEKEEGNKKFASYMMEQEDAKNILTTAGLLHDIGESVIKMNMLNSGDPMSDEEMMVKHVEMGEQVLSEIPSIPSKVQEVIAQHEERFDGSGPKKLKRGQISLYGQLVGLANYFDRQVTKEGMTKDEALEVVQTSMDKFDPNFVSLLSEIIEEVYNAA